MYTNATYNYKMHNKKCIINNTPIGGDSRYAMLIKYSNIYKRI